MLRSLKRLSVISMFFFAGFANADTNAFTNVRFSPLGLLFGSYAITADVAVTPEWTIGPELSYGDVKIDSNSAYFSRVEVKSYSIGARANWFKNGVFSDGLYVGPALYYSSAKAMTNDSQGNVVDATASTPVISGIVGYGWFWDNFNIMLGLGAAAALGDRKVTFTDRNGQTDSPSVQTVYPTGEFSFGFTF